MLVEGKLKKVRGGCIIMIYHHLKVPVPSENVISSVMHINKISSSKMLKKYVHTILEIGSFISSQNMT